MSERKIILIDPDAAAAYRGVIGNITPVPEPIAKLLELATREERILLLGVTCRSRHKFFDEFCTGCQPDRARIFQTLVERAASPRDSTVR